MKTLQIVLKRHPEGIPDKKDFGIEEVELPGLEEGKVLLDVDYFSVDPYLRMLMSEPTPHRDAFELNGPVAGAAVARVAESKSDLLAVGDSVTGNLPWSQKVIAGAGSLQKIDTSFVPASAYLGVLGMTGLTGFFGLTDVGRPKAGETVVISGAAGAVGIQVGQIAKLLGCRVVGIAGSDDKVRFLKQEIGFDGAVNYKTEDISEALDKACPEGIDIYFDNVGGPVSDTVIGKTNSWGRIVLCGQISTYNQTEERPGMNVLPLVLLRNLTISGFHVNNYQDRYPEAIRQLSEWVREGKLKMKETVVEGLENLPEAFIGLFSGKNTGKMIVKV